MMKKSIKCGLLFAVVIVLYSSCKKDPRPPLDGYLPCVDENFIPPPPGLIQTTYQEGAQYTLPVFNPNNPNEFAYQHFENDVYQLRRHNIQTGADVLLVNDVDLISKPSWSSSDWIAFDSYPLYRIRAIHARNETMVQISNEIYGLYPLWMPDGDELMYQYSPVLGIPYYLIKIDFDEGVVSEVPADTLFNGPHQAMSIASNAPLIAGKFETIGDYFLGYSSTELDALNLDHVVIPNIHVLINIFSTCIAPDGSAIYFTTYLNNPDDGLFKVDVASGTLEKVLGHCRFEQITDIDCSPDGNHLIMVRQHERFGYHENGQPDGKIYQQSRIYLLNLNTGEEELIEIE